MGLLKNSHMSSNTMGRIRNHMNNNDKRYRVSRDTKRFKEFRRTNQEAYRLLGCFL